VRGHLRFQHRLRRPLHDSPQAPRIVEQDPCATPVRSLPLCSAIVIPSSIVVPSAPLSWRTVASPVTRPPSFQNHRDITSLQLVEREPPSPFGNTVEIDECRH
jgi:hypothetical protein